nr:ribonuclease H-like domain-containing protein [Tanacetum cinerariifolium]
MVPRAVLMKTAPRPLNTARPVDTAHTKCVVLSPDFKLLDESQVLLRVLRKNNKYSVDLKNVPPSGATKDETSGILKAFITGLGNLIDHKVKIISCDNGTKFKNKKMNQFCEEKGIKREFTVARTPQHNQAEAVNTTCYVQNRVLVIKPHNKIPYELFNARTPSLSFMRPFGCPVTILNTLDPLGSGPTWLFDIDTLTKSMNYKPVVAGNESNASIGKARVETEEKKDAEGLGNIDSEVPNTKEPRINQEKDVNVNITNNINAVSLTINTTNIKDNVVDENIVYGCADDPNMPNLEEIVYSDDDDEEVSVKADMTNLDTNIPGSTQEEGLDYDEAFAPVAKIEAIRAGGIYPGTLPLDRVEALGSMRFGNDQFAPILEYGDLVQGNVTIKKIYYVERINQKLFSIGQSYGADLEVAFWKSTCYVRDLKGNDLLTGSHGTYLCSITLQEITYPNPTCLMAKDSSSQAWIWHRRLSHLNFDTIDLLSKNDIVNGLPKLKFIKDHLCSSYDLRKAKCDFNSHQEKRLSHLRTQLEQQRDDMIRKINLLWKTVSKKLNNAHILNLQEALWLLKYYFNQPYQEGGTQKKGNQKPIKAPKRIHFVNSIVNLGEENEDEQGETTTNITPEHGYNITKEAKDEVKEVIDEEESEMGTDEEIEEILEDEEEEEVVTPFSSIVGQRSGPFSTESSIILPCCVFNMYSSIMLFHQSYMSFSNIGGRLSAPKRIALSARVVILKFVMLKIT